MDWLHFPQAILRYYTRSIDLEPKLEKDVEAEVKIAEYNW